MQSFFDRSGGLARGMGFLARFIVGWPESTQGSRFFTEAPANWPHMAVFHRRITAILANAAPMDDGELYDVRDVASKSADNAVRLAALFQMFEHGMGAVSLEAFEGASRIAAWHLHEARRFFGELALPTELADAARLDSWLSQYCRRERMQIVGKNHVRQHGPLRDGPRLDAAISELANLDRLRLAKDGRRRIIQMNPVLVRVAS